MSEKTVHPLVKTGLDLGPIVLFFVAYLALRDHVFLIGGREYSGFILVTAGFIPVMALATFILWRLTGTLSKMQVLTLVLVVLFGGLSVWLNDERFFKMKPTMIYLLFGGALAVGLLRGESYLRLLMEGLMPLNHEGWLKLTRRFMAFFFALAAANELVWRLMSTDVWVSFKTFGLPLAIMAFMLSQGRLLSAYAAEEESGPDNAA